MNKELTQQELIRVFSAYLPYKLKVCTSYRNDKWNNPKTLLGADIDRLSHKSNSTKLKPILWDLSMLTKEITHEGKTFVPIKEIELIMNDDMQMDSEDVFMIGKIENGPTLLSIEEMPYFVIHKLLEWHLNVFSLQEDQFINKATLKNGKN